MVMDGQKISKYDFGTPEGEDEDGGGGDDDDDDFVDESSPPAPS